MLDGRRILVTGGSSGIGRGLAIAYAAHGARVWAVGRRRPALDETVSTAPPGRVAPLVADLTTEEGRRSVVGAIDSEGGELDVVVHAAGALGPVGVALAAYPIEDWRRVFEINVTAVHLLHAALIPRLEAGTSPTVIGVSSTVGRKGRAGWGMYAVSKYALEGWLAILADEWDGRVYSVNPGGTRTPMRAAAVPGEDPQTLPTPEDITPLFLRLAHPRALEPSGAVLDARDWIGRDPWEDADREGGVASPQ